VGGGGLSAYRMQMMNDFSSSSTSPEVGQRTNGLYHDNLLGPAFLGRVLASCCKNDIWSICLVVI
jgi:hypothetical protein